MALSAPQQSGDMLSQGDVENHTMVVTPTEFIEHIQTVNTKPGEKSPAIRVNVVDFSTPDSVPTKYEGVLWFGVISTGLRRQIGQTILGRMGKGQATPGKNAPWQLQDIMAETDWVNYANSWLATEEGQQWEIDCINEINRLATQAQIAGAAAPTQQAPAAAPVTQQAPPPAPPARPAAVAAPPTAPPAPAGPPAAVGSAPGATASALPAGLEALIAAMPADQQAAARAVLAAQQVAAS